MIIKPAKWIVLKATLLCLNFQQLLRYVLTSIHLMTCFIFPILVVLRIDVIVTLECINLYILCIVPRCLLREVSVMYLSHVMPGCSYQEVL